MKLQELRKLIKEELEEVTLSSEFIDRIEGLSNMKTLDAFKLTLKKLSKEWIEEGFEIEDILDYIKTLLKENNV
jgi:hypothetical protein